MPKLRDASQVLVFNSLKKLVAVFGSINSAACTLSLTLSAVQKACTGETISCHKLYFRYANSKVELEPNDFGHLTVIDFDKMLGVNDRKYYKTKEMSKTNII